MEWYRLDLSLDDVPDNDLLDQLASVTTNAITSLKRDDEEISIRTPQPNKLRLLWSAPIMLPETTLRLAEEAVENLAFEIVHTQYGLHYSHSGFQHEVQLVIGLPQARGFIALW